MTFLTRYNSLNDGFFEPFFGRFTFGDEALTSGNWAPPVDVAEENDKIMVKVEVPGVDEQDLKVHFEDGLLTVSGERQFERKDTRNYYRIERTYGTFTRTFSLPRSVDPNGISISCQDEALPMNSAALFRFSDGRDRARCGTACCAVQA